MHLGVVNCLFWPVARSRSDSQALKLAFRESLPHGLIPSFDIEVVARRTGDTLAIINYGWESLEFYARKLGSGEYAQEVVSASLDPLNPQSRHAPILLAVFRDVVRDPDYKERLARHYRMFKAKGAPSPS